MDNYYIETMVFAVLWIVTMCFLAAEQRKSFKLFMKLHTYMATSSEQLFEKQKRIAELTKQISEKS